MNHLVLRTLVSCACAAWSVDARAVLNCDQLLRTPGARASQRALLQVYVDDADVQDDVLAYVGISPGDLVKLLNTGVLSGAPSALPAFLEAAHPTVCTLKKRWPDHDLGWIRGGDIRQRAAVRARARALGEVLAQRFPGADPNGRHLVEIASKFPYGPADPPSFSPSFRQITNAAEASKIPSSRRNDMYARTHGLCLLLEIPWQTIDLESSPTRSALAFAFMNLPARAGLVLALRREALPKLQLGKYKAPYAKRIETADVLAVEALSNVEDDFLRRSGDYLGVRPTETEIEACCS